MTLLCATVIVAMGLWKGAEMAYFAAGAATMSLAWIASFTVDSSELRRYRDGARGETFTASTIRRLYRDGWRAVDHIELDGFGDVDHVIAGPGGAFAVETKWTNEPWQIISGRFTNSHARDAVDQCRRGAQRIRLMLKTSYDVDQDVRPLLVIWGPGRPTTTGQTFIDGVLVVPGTQLGTTLGTLPAALRNPIRDLVVDAVEHIVALRQERDWNATSFKSSTSWVA